MKSFGVSEKIGGVLERAEVGGVGGKFLFTEGEKFGVSLEAVCWRSLHVEIWLSVQGLVAAANYTPKLFIK